MSMPQILATVKEALQDPDVGFTASIEALAQLGSANVRSDFVLRDWAIAGMPADTREPNITVRPVRWDTVGNASDTGHRDALASLAVDYECFDADPHAIQNTVALAASALARVLDALRDYSDRTGGTIIDLQDPIGYDFGQFAGATSHGFTATFTLSERSTL